jgi:hypothetical protein
VARLNPRPEGPIQVLAVSGGRAIVEDGGITHLRVVCPTCGEVKVGLREVTIRNCVDTDEWSYWFACGSCRLRAAGSTNRRAAIDAVCAGSNFETWQLPAELHERSDAPPLTFVDLLELQLALIEPDWIDRLTT